MSPPSKTPCEEHADQLKRIQERLEKGDMLLQMVKDIRVAVCGDPQFGIPGLISLHEKVALLERQRTWILGAAAVIGAAFPFVWAVFVK